VDSQEVEANIEELERNVTYGGEDDEYMEETMTRGCRPKKQKISGTELMKELGHIGMTIWPLLRGGDWGGIAETRVAAWRCR
jgi:hypothetical protein